MTLIWCDARLEKAGQELAVLPPRRMTCPRRRLERSTGRARAQRIPRVEVSSVLSIIAEPGGVRADA
jgi:hypothetical protein